jgi:hypothetical protein
MQKVSPIRRNSHFLVGEMAIWLVKTPFTVSLTKFYLNQIKRLGTFFVHRKSIFQVLNRGFLVEAVGKAVGQLLAIGV